MTKVYLLLILNLCTLTYSTKITDYIDKNELENSKRIFIVKPNENVKKLDIHEEKSENTEIPEKKKETNEDSKIEKKIEEIQESIKLINSDSTAIIPRLKEVSTIKVTGINKEIILKGSKKEIEDAKYIILNLDKPKKQIKIKATIIDTSDNLFERLGINLNVNTNQNENSSEFFGNFLNGDLSLTGIIKKGSNFLGINVDLLKENGDVQMIRRAETPKDYFATFDFSDALDKLNLK